MSSISEVLQSLPSHTRGYILLDEHTNLIKASTGVSPSLSAQILGEAQRAALSVRADASVDEDTLRQAGSTRLDKTIAVPCSEGYVPCPLWGMQYYEAQGHWPRCKLLISQNSHFTLAVLVEDAPESKAS